MQSGSISRRRLLSFPTVFAGSMPSNGGPSARVESAEVIASIPQSYPGWPTLTRLKSGQLVAVYSGSREAHVCPFGRVELVRSHDDGKTWSWPQVLMDTPIDDRDAGIVETPKGALLVTTFTSLAYEKVLSEAKDWLPEKLERWMSVQRATTAEQRRSLLGAWMLRSTDSGLTWSKPYRVPLTSPHGPVALSDGRMLFAGKLYPSEQGGIEVWASHDDGVSWSRLASIPTRPGDDAAQYHELHAVEAANGALIAHIRNHNKANAGETLQSESVDGGKSWSVPRAIGVWGLPSHLLRLRDGRLLMTYSYRRPPRGNQARISADNGRTWSEPLVISDDGIGDLGYPSTVELPGRQLLSLWYEAREPKTPGPRISVLRVARWLASNQEFR